MFLLCPIASCCSAPSEKLEQLRYLEYGKKIKMVETNVQGVEIDTPEDLERAKKLWK